MEPTAQQVPEPQTPQPPVAPQPQVISTIPVPPKTKSGKGMLILLGALLIVIIGGIISIVIVMNSSKTADNPYARSQEAIAKAAEEMQKTKVTPTPLSLKEQRLKEIDNDLTNIDRENEEIDQGLKDSLPDLSI